MTQTINLKIDNKLQNTLENAQSYFPGLTRSQVIRVVFLRYFEEREGNRKVSCDWRSLKKSLSKVTYGLRSEEEMTTGGKKFDSFLHDKKKQKIRQEEYEEAYDDWWNTNKQVLRG